MGTEIDPDLVRHVGKLSRIELDDEQVRAYARQLGGILSFFGKLQELDTEGVEPLAHPLDRDTVLAADEPSSGLTPEEALANAPERDGDYFRVPKVIGDSQ